MKNLGQMMKQAQEMQGKMAEMQASLDEKEVDGSAGAGMVTVTLSAKGDMRKLTIDPSLFNAEDKEVVEDLILAAHNDARAKAQEMSQDAMQQLTGGMNLPDGFKLPF